MLPVGYYLQQRILLACDYQVMKMSRKDQRYAGLCEFQASQGYIIIT